MILSLATSSKFVPSYLETSTPAWIGHLPFAYWLVSEQRPQTIVELGTHYGNSYFTMCQAVADNGYSTECFAVDCWEGDTQAGTYEGTVYQAVEETNRNKYKSFSSLLRMTFEDALPLFRDGSVDLLHVDGLHTYEAVKCDFESWRPKLSDRAIVLFHDTAVKKADFGVRRFWRELSMEHECHVEFSHNFGLGVLWAQKKVFPRAPAWLRKNSFSKWYVHRVFENRGIRLAMQHKTKKKQ